MKFLLIACDKKTPDIIKHKIIEEASLDDVHENIFDHCEAMDIGLAYYAAYDTALPFDECLADFKEYVHEAIADLEPNWRHS